MSETYGLHFWYFVRPQDIVHFVIDTGARSSTEPQTAIRMCFSRNRQQPTLFSYWFYAQDAADVFCFSFLFLRHVFAAWHMKGGLKMGREKKIGK